MLQLLSTSINITATQTVNLNTNTRTNFGASGPAQLPGQR